MVCFDTAIDIRSQPVPASDITPYKLGRSTYDEGCFPPCECLLREWPISGTFHLLPLTNAMTPIRREFAVVDVKWMTISPTTARGRTFSGFGWYQIVEVGTMSSFDSGVVSGGTGFPRIDIRLAVNGFYCFDRVFLLHAKPIK